MEASDARDILFKELIVSNRPLSLLLSMKRGHRVSCRRRTIVGVALEKTKDRDGIVLFTACPANWIDQERVRDLVPDAKEVPIRMLATGPIFAAAAAGDGINIPRCATGSLGVLVEDTRAKSRYFLSCNHVIADCNRARLGHTVISNIGPHGAPRPSAHLGSLHRFHNIDFRAGMINYVDAALGDPIPTHTIPHGVGGHRIAVCAAPPRPPLDVQKWGWATGCTTGKLTFFASGFALTYAHGGMAIFDRQLGILGGPAGSFAQPGDSGALVIDTGKFAVGLLFAVTTCGTVAFANAIDAVLHTTTGWNLRIV